MRLYPGSSLQGPCGDGVALAGSHVPQAIRQRVLGVEERNAKELHVRRLLRGHEEGRRASLGKSLTRYALILSCSVSASKACEIVSDGEGGGEMRAEPCG